MGHLLGCAVGGMRATTSHSGAAPRQRRQAGRVTDILRHYILEGRYEAHQPLPPYRDLAESFGVSKATIGHAVAVLEDEGLVSCAERKGAFVRPFGASLQTDTRDTHVKCVTVVTRSQPISDLHVRSDYLAGYTAALDDQDARLRFALVAGHDERPEGIFSPRFNLVEQGCILVNLADPGLMHWLNDQGIPFVVQYYKAYSSNGLPPHHSVVTNKYQGAFEATQYLIELGHHRVGYIGRVDPANAEPIMYDACRAALNVAGLPCIPQGLSQSEAVQPAVITLAATEWLKIAQRPTAVIAGNDTCAIAVLKAAQSLGIGIPEELSIIGFNDEPESRETIPPLTTVANPRRALAQEAIMMLFDAASGRIEAPQRKALECQLVVRGSTAGPWKEGEARECSVQNAEQ